MSESIARTERMEWFLDRVAGIDAEGGDPRTKQIVRRIVSDLYRTIEDFDVSPDEYWSAIAWIGRLGQEREHALVSPGLGFDHFIDLRLDQAEAEAGLEGGTPRTIEGPLFVAGAPRVKGYGRLDDGTESGEMLYMHGQVRSDDGAPIGGAIVEVWHADTRGNYSYFDPTQSAFNLRRSIETDADGRYRFRSILPRGYGCPPSGPTQDLLDRLGRHGQRPAHIHFFVSASGHRQLTTQINIADDPLVNDDFAFATRDELIPEIVRHRSGSVPEAEIEGAYAEIAFDFVLHRTSADAPLPPDRVQRERAALGA